MTGFCAGSGFWWACSFTDAPLLHTGKQRRNPAVKQTGCAFLAGAQLWAWPRVCDTLSTRRAGRGSRQCHSLCPAETQAIDEHRVLQSGSSEAEAFLNVLVKLRVKQLGRQLNRLICLLHPYLYIISVSSWRSNQGGCSPTGNAVQCSFSLGFSCWDVWHWWIADQLSEVKQIRCISAPPWMQTLFSWGLGTCGFKTTMLSKQILCWYPENTEEGPLSYSRSGSCLVFYNATILQAVLHFGFGEWLFWSPFEEVWWHWKDLVVPKVTVLNRDWPLPLGN